MRWGQDWARIVDSQIGGETLGHSQCRSLGTTSQRSRKQPPFPRGSGSTASWGLHIPGFVPIGNCAPTHPSPPVVENGIWSPAGLRVRIPSSAELIHLSGASLATPEKTTAMEAGY